MSFVAPQLPANLAGLNEHSGLQDIAKALGYGLVTTDAAVLTQGGAATTESLDTVFAEMLVKDEHFKVFNSVSTQRAGQIIDQWIEVYDNGFRDGMTISDIDGSTKDGNRKGRRRYIRLKFMTSRYSVNKAVISQQNFLQEFNQEDVYALTRVRQDQAWMFWEGDASLGELPGEPGSGDEFDGVYHYASSTNWSNYDGNHQIDLMGNGYSGLDAQGYSNPADIVTALERFAQIAQQPINGVAQTPKIYMGASPRSDVNAYKNFQSYQILGPGPQSITTGSIIQNFANPYTDQRYTEIMQDNFMPDPLNQWDLAPQLRRTGGATITAFTFVSTVLADPASRFTTSLGFVGSYDYWFAPFGRQLDGTYFWGVAQYAGAAVVTSGDKVRWTVTIPGSVNAAGLGVYRTAKGAGNDLSKARLIKRIPVNPGGPTVFEDLNRTLPGACKLYIIDVTNPNVVQMRYAYEPFRVGLPIDQNKINLLPAAVSASAGLRTKLHRSIAVIENYVPRSAGFSPKG